MFYPSGRNRKHRKNNDKINNKIIKHIPLHMTVTKQSSNINNEKIKISAQIGPDVYTAKVISSNIRSNEKEGTITKMVSQATLNTKSIADVLHNIDKSAEPVMLFCMNMMQNQDIVVVSLKDLPYKGMYLETLTKSDSNNNKLLSYKKDRPNATIITTEMPKGYKCYVNMYLLLPYIRAICDAVQLTHEKQIKAIAQEPPGSAGPILAEINIQTKILFNENKKSSTITLNNEQATQIYKQNSIDFEVLSKPISSEFQLTRCLRIFNKMLTEFVKIYFTLRDDSSTNHKIISSLCFHNWHFRNLTQGYILKHLLRNDKLNVLNMMRNLYFIIITKCTSSKIDIFFRVQDGIFMIFNDSQPGGGFTKQIIINKPSIIDLHNMSYSDDATNQTINNMQSESDKESGCCSYSSSLNSLPDYPSQNTLFIEEEIKSWQQLADETPEYETVNDSFANSDFNQNINEVYLNFWSNIYQLTDVLYKLKCNTSDIVHCYTAEVFSKYDVFNENLFYSNSFDSLFNKDARKFGTTFLLTLGKSLAYTMFSYVL